MAPFIDAGGPSILAGCRRIVSQIGTLPPGEAVITTGGRSAAKYVIHTVGPVYRGGGQGEGRNWKVAIASPSGWRTSTCQVFIFSGDLDWRLRLPGDGSGESCCGRRAEALALTKHLNRGSIRSL